MANNLWPIWKDTNNIASAAVVTASIYKSSSLVFQDYFYAPPGATQSTVNLNRYVESMIEVPNLDLLTGSNAYISFHRDYDPSTWTLEMSPVAYEQSYRFYPDWSYDINFDWQNTDFFSKPISRKFTEGQYLLQSWYGNSTESLQKYFYLDSTKEAYMPVNPGTFLHGGCLVEVCATTCSTEDWTWDEHVDADYAIYYLNPYGGFDSFPLEGKSTEEVDYEWSSVINPSRNKYSYKVGKETRWTLNTGLLKDEESVLMDNLLSSPLVYLHHINKTLTGGAFAGQGGRIWRVRVDVDSVQKKTFKNQDRNFPSYEFQVVKCQQTIRR